MENEKNTIINKLMFNIILVILGAVLFFWGEKTLIGDEVFSRDRIIFAVFSAALNLPFVIALMKDGGKRGEKDGARHYTIRREYGNTFTITNNAFIGKIIGVAVSLLVFFALARIALIVVTCFRIIIIFILSIHLLSYRQKDSHTKVIDRTKSKTKNKSSNKINTIKKADPKSEDKCTELSIDWLVESKLYEEAKLHVKSTGCWTFMKMFDCYIEGVPYAMLATTEAPSRYEKYEGNTYIVCFDGEITAVDDDNIINRVREIYQAIILD